MARDDDQGAGGPGKTAGTSPGADEVSAPGDGAADPVEEFLRSAPPEVLTWLRQRAAKGGAAPAPEGDAAGLSPADAEAAASASRAEGAPDRDLNPDSGQEAPRGEGDPDDEDLDLLEDEDDDILQRRRAKKARAAAAKSSPADPEATPPRSRSRLRGALVICLAVAVGITAGFLLAKQPSGGTAAPAATMSSSVSDAQAEARIAELEETLAKAPEDTDAHLEIGVLLFNQGELDQASRHWQTVVKLEPKAAEAWYDLGFYYLSTEPADEEAAREAWDKVIAIDPDSDLARKAQNHLDAAMSGSTSSPSATPSASTKG